MKRTWHTLLPLAGVLAVTNGRAAAEPSTPGPASVGTRACLFLDDRFIAEQSGLKRTWHQGKPRPEVAVVEDVGKGKWEKWPHLYGSVLYDPQARRYRMYYTSAVWPSRTPGQSFTSYICYAESQDGKTWTKPVLGLYEDLGSKQNNIVIPLAEFAKVFIDPLEKDPSARLKMFTFLKAYTGPGGKSVHPLGGFYECLLSSGDGVSWKFVAGFNRPDWADPDRAPLSKFTDSYSFMFDPLQQRYMAYIRTMAKSHVAESKKDSKRRAIGVTHSAGINRGWSPIVHVMEPDARDDEKVAPLSKDPKKPDWAEHYSLSFFTYGNHYLGLLSLIYLIDDSDANGGGDLQLIYSHDGETWLRQPDRQTLIAPSNAAPELFPTYVSNNGPLEIGDELWLYYTEANGAHPIAPSVGVARSQIRAATWRKDGFVSLDAAGPASLTTRPLKFDGKRLLINAQVQPAGSLRVALLDEAGKPLPGYAAADCDAVTGDRVAGVVNWKGKTDLSGLAGKAVRLRMEMARCRLFSFRAAE